MMTTLKITRSLVLTGALVTAACGDSKSSMLPTAPSAVGAAAQSLEAGAPGAVSDTMGLKDKLKDKEKDKEKEKGKDDKNNGNPTQPTAPTLPTVPGNVTPPTTTTPTAPSTKTVQLEGVISAKGSNTITVNSELVSVSSTTVIRHGWRTYKFADLRVGDRVHVKGKRSASAASGDPAATTLVASEVKLQNASRSDSGS